MTGDRRGRGWDDMHNGYEQRCRCIETRYFIFTFVVNAFGIGLKTAIENKVGMLQWDTFFMMECTN